MAVIFFVKLLFLLSFKLGYTNLYRRFHSWILFAPELLRSPRFYPVSAGWKALALPDHRSDYRAPAIRTFL
jgi:hypothetical protein